MQHNFNYLSGDGQTFDNFYRVDCQIQDVIDNNYQEIQDKFVNHNTSVISTYMRCYMNRDHESKMFHDTYKVRYIDDATCAYIKNNLMKYKNPLNVQYNTIPSFREHTKLRPIIQNTCRSITDEELCKKCQN